MRRKTIILSIFLLAVSVTSEGAVLNGNRNGKPFFKNISALEYGGHNRNFDIECDTTGKVYVANFEGLLEWDGVRWSMIHTPGISRVTSLHKTEKQQIWFGGYNVLGYLDADDKAQYIVTDTSANIKFGEVLQIRSHKNVIEFDAGSNRYSIENGRLKEGYSIASESVKTSIWQGYEVNEVLVLDNLGYTALATTENGIIIFDQEGDFISKLTTEDGLCSNNIESIAYDGKGGLWGATNNGLFIVTISQVFSMFDTTDGLNGQVTSILHHNGTLYVGTLQGLFIQTGDSHFKKASEINLACWQIISTPSGAILGATAEGLFIHDNSVKQLTSRHTLSVVVDDDGSFITGETDGIYRVLPNGQSQKMNNIQNVSRFEKDEDGGIWAITYYDETYLKPPKDARFRSKDRDDLTLLFGYTDLSGRYWHADDNNMGLYCDQLTETESKWCKLLDSYSIEAMEVSDNVIYVGGNFGLIRLSLYDMGLEKPFEPVLYIRSLNQDNATLNLSVSIDKSDPLGVPKYSYKLRANDNWSRWTTYGQMDFANLSSGNYSLSVRAVDSYGNIVEKDPYLFKVHPPFYLKWYAFIVYVLLVAGITFGFIRIKLLKAKMEQERLERIVDQRTSQLKEAQNQLLRQEKQATVGKLTSGLIDRILNPMNYINNFSHLTIDLSKDLLADIEDEKENMNADTYDDCLDIADMMKNNLEKIEQHGLATTRILKAMEELLKDRSGKVEQADIVQICKKDYEMCLTYHKAEIDELGIDVQLRSSSDSIMVNVNQENLSKAIMSLMANGFYAVHKKFMKDSGGTPIVRIEVAEAEKGCMIKVFDNGIGIEESIIDKIFDPFFTTKPTAEAPGVGLYLSQQVIQDFGGSISVESKKDEYTIFTIILP